MDSVDDLYTQAMDDLHTDCPQCVAERVAEKLITRDAPPAPCHQHAHSDPKETKRKELTQCQYCFKSKGPGVTLQRCGGCEIDIYCVRNTSYPRMSICFTHVPRL
ncbi:hypothetical protein B0H12DRAFT_1109058 [Mycena haematopus]|nr:hypothetical protein B0H12DRAFT_1109058 [Mycena haematopus]